MAIRRGGFTDGAAPIEDTRDADGKETRIVLYAELCQPPERQCLEFAFGDDQRQLCISQQRNIGAWRQIKHVAAAWRAQVLLFDLQLATGIRFQIGVVAPQSVLADMPVARRKVRDRDAGVIATLPSDKLRSGPRVHAAQEGGLGQWPFDPPGLKSREVCGRKLGTDQVRRSRKVKRFLLAAGKNTRFGMFVSPISFWTYIG